MCAVELTNALPRLLIVDADPAICCTLQHILHHYGYQVCATTDPAHARALVASEPFDLLLIAAGAHSPIADAALMLGAAAPQPCAARMWLHDGSCREPDNGDALDRHASPTAIAIGVAQALARRAIALSALEAVGDVELR